MPKNVHFLDFVVFPDLFLSKNLPISPWPTTVGNDVFSIANPLHDVHIATLWWWDDAKEQFPEPGFVLMDSLAHWFRDCWQKAGGSHYRLPSYLTAHDDIQSFCLHRGKWVEQEEKYKPWPNKSLEATPPNGGAPQL
jgi:hypothetical protein